jgi:ABC-type sugar transport system ATPase subunit
MSQLLPKPWLRLDHVTVEFPGALACDDVSVELGDGEIVGLAGKNGAGKSTLIKVLAGVYAPTSGTVVVDHRPLRIHSTRHARDLGLAFVHQELNPMPSVSVAEYISLGLGYPRRFGLFIHWRRLRHSAKAVLGDLGADDIDPRTLMGDLSIAQQRLVMIARAMFQDARLLVLDEPTASLTDGEVVHLHRIMRRLRDRGVCVVFVTHRLDEMLELSDRIIVMRDGAVVADRLRQAVNPRTLIELITGSGAGAAAVDLRRGTASRSIGSAAPALEAVNLVGGPLVRGVSFTAFAGEILGIAGLSGSGRSELLHLLFGAARATAGTVRLRGEHLKLRGPHSAMRAGIALLPEDRREAGLIQEFCIGTNITLASLPKYRMHPLLPFPHRGKERASVTRLMTLLSVKSAGGRQIVQTLSGGNQQKVVLAKWLDRDATVLLFDEPTLGVDIDAREEIYREMERLAAAGCTLLFVSSDFSELVGICGRVLIMRDGRIESELVGEQITEHAITEQCYTESRQSRKSA